jgi:hypothetical protein
MVDILFYIIVSSQRSLTVYNWTKTVMLWYLHFSATDLSGTKSVVPSVQSMMRKFPGIILLSMITAFTYYSMLFPFKVVPLQLDTVSPLTVPLLGASVNVLCLGCCRCSLWLFLNHAEVIKSTAL